MSADRDKFLTEAMGSKIVMCCVVEGDMDIDQTCVRQDDYDGYRSECIHGEKGKKPEDCEFWQSGFVEGVTDFSTWAGFGKLWEWAVDQEWWGPWFYRKSDEYAGSMQSATLGMMTDLNNPDRFATAVYEYLKQ